jgi:hypothetical protein
MLLAIAAVAAVLGVHLAYWDNNVPPQFGNYPVVLGWYLVATAVASAMSLTGRYALRTPFLATAVFGWAFFALVLQFGHVDSITMVPWLERTSWMGLSIMGACLLVAMTVVSVTTRPEPTTVPRAPSP